MGVRRTTRTLRTEVPQRLIGSFVELRFFGSWWFVCLYRAYTRWLRGSKASRRPSPIKLIDTTVRRIIRPGKTANQG